jgi:hypothetical protein
MKRLEVDCLLVSVIVMMRIMLIERPSHPIIYKSSLYQITPNSIKVIPISSTEPHFTVLVRSVPPPWLGIVTSCQLSQLVFPGTALPRELSSSPLSTSHWPDPAELGLDADRFSAFTMGVSVVHISPQRLRLRANLWLGTCFRSNSYFYLSCDFGIGWSQRVFLSGQLCGTVRKPPQQSSPS